MPKITISDDLTLSVDTVAYLYRNLSVLIQQHYRQAKEKDQKLLIMLGEHHFSSHAFLIKTIILNISKDLGIQNLYYETSQKTNNLSQVICAFELDIIGNILGRVKPRKKERDKIDDLSSDTNITFDTREYYFRTHRNAIKLGFNILPIDDFNGRPNFDLRNKIMAEHLKRHNQHGILVTGFSHIPGLVNCDLGEKYHVLPINVCYMTATERESLKFHKKWGNLDFLITRNLNKRDFSQYTFQKAQESSVDYLEPNMAVQIVFDVSQGCSVLDNSGKILNVQFKTNINRLLRQIKRPSIISMLLEIPTNFHLGFSFVSSLCKKPSGLSQEMILYFQEIERKSIIEFENLKETDEPKIFRPSASSLLPLKIKLNLRSMQAIDELNRETPSLQKPDSEPSNQDSKINTTEAHTLVHSKKTCSSKS